MRPSAHLLLPALLVAAFAPSAPAQVTTGWISGMVLDEAGDPIPGARVDLEGSAAFQPRTYLTDAKGCYRALLLPVGTYTIKVSADGKLSRTATDVRVGVGTYLSIPFVLKTLRTTESVTVEVVACMATESKSCDKVSVNYSVEQSAGVSGKLNPNATLHLAPGVTGYLAQIRGSATNQVMYRIDGIDVRDGAACATPQSFNTEAYNPVSEQPFQDAMRAPLSTFSVDVDTASYSNMRRYLDSGSLPPKDSVRIEEWINAFQYDYPDPEKGRPASVQTEVLACPWEPGHQLLRVGIQARRLPLDKLPARNLVFLVDVSGSMGEENKLPLVQAGLKRLCASLRDIDRVAIVVYAGSSGLVLEPTSGAGRARILDALDHLQAGGSTNGAEGIQLAYEVARRHFQKEADNRVVLCTDGDFNVGVSDQGSLVRLIEQQRQSGVFLTCLGFGMGNLKDGTLEQLADKGNGHYGYIDSLPEMERFFGAGGASLVTVAKDVKVQVEFNPALVQAYRLIGYENRRLEAEDFKNDAKDAGEMNAGHSVTALYELVPPGLESPVPAVDPLKYQTGSKLKQAAAAELLTVKLRYKQPDGFMSRQMEFPVQARLTEWKQASLASRWAAAVATFGLHLLDSPFKGQASLELAHSLATSSVGEDKDGLRQEMLQLIEKARTLKGQTDR